MKAAVITFPASNCDRDAITTLQKYNDKVDNIWHKETNLDNGYDLIILPGGFSFGDYLRTGSIARFSPIMDEVIKFANNGGKVLGICNGFQILCESGLLPGVLLRNKNQKFYCENQTIKVANDSSAYTHLLKKDDVLNIPVAHADGCYFCDDSTLGDLKANNQILFQYSDKAGTLTDDANFNGSVANIAGVMNKEGNVFGMMPHPERASEPQLGNTDGLRMLEGLISQAQGAN